MAKQEVPKRGISEKDLNRVILESANVKPKEVQMITEYESYPAKDSIGVSSKNQSSPGKTSGGFSYKLKKD
jgi:hypothetical protein